MIFVLKMWKIWYNDKIFFGMPIFLRNNFGFFLSIEFISQFKIAIKGILSVKRNLPLIIFVYFLQTLYASSSVQNLVQF